MDEIALRKSEIEEKLKQDEENLARFTDSLKRSDDLTKNMVGILDSFSDRLNKLEKTIQPVHHQTLSLTTLKDNVDKLLDALERVIGFHHLSDEVEEKIKRGPSGNVESYLSLMDRLHTAVEFFQQSNPGSVELGSVTTLFEDGLEQLNSTFRELLKQHSKRVPDGTLIDIANASSEEEVPILEHLPHRVVQDLVAISKYLAGPGQTTDFMSVYHQIRSTQLGRSLVALREYYKAFQIMPLSQTKQRPSIANLLKGESPVKRGVKRKPADSRRDGSLRRGLLEQATVSSGRMEADEQLEGSGVFIALATVCVRLLESEHDLMTSIIAQQHWTMVYESLVIGPFNLFVKLGEDLHDKAKKSMSKHDFIVVVSTCKVIRHLRMLLPQYKKLLQPLPNRCYHKIPEVIAMFEKLTLKGLNELLTFIKADPEKQSNMPKDGTVHQLTSNAMLFLEQLLEQMDIAGGILAEQDIVLSSMTDIEQANRKAIGNYIIRVFDVVNISMESKAKLYESSTLSSIFLMNNYHFIRRTFTRNQLMLSVLEEVYPDVDGKYNELIGAQRAVYTKRFNKLLSFVGQTTALPITSNPDRVLHLGKSQREAIKDKYKGFNTEIEELQKIQRHYTIPDRDLRSSVKEVNRDLICPLYEEFHKNHLNVSFTKNPDKYIKYQPVEVEGILNSFFDGQSV
ncbi:exocyst complex component 7-like [Dysidea avara]|uniref:exocyst complex component 7-like n=1 Tax=Dysidea avara TaxID=196820 RepID=UPI00332A30C0